MTEKSENPASREHVTKGCPWSYDEADGMWQSACGVCFYFENDAGLEENGYKYCHKCGKPISSLMEAPAPAVNHIADTGKMVGDEMEGGKAE